MTITDDQYEALIEELQKNRELSEDIQKNWNLDREDFNGFKNRLGHLETELANFKEIVNKLPITIKQSVADSLKQLTKETANLKKAIEKKKTLALNLEVIKKKRWWEFFKRG